MHGHAAARDALTCNETVCMAEAPPLVITCRPLLRRRRFDAVPSLVALLAAWLAFAPARVAATDVLGLETLDDEVPAFTLQAAAADAPALDNAALAGRLVLMHFWATWCTPCRKELPALQALAHALDSARVAVVLVAIDDADTSREAIVDYARGLGLDAPLYLARDSRISDRFWSWGVPVSYLIDARGHFVGRMLGPRPWDSPALRDALANLSPPRTP